MYRIEIYVEDGNWSVSIQGSLGLAAEKKNKRLKHTQYKWNPSGGSWVVLGGVYNTADDALAAIALFQRCSSDAKPVMYRVTGRR